MKLRTLRRIIKWFEEYQPNLTNKEGKELYEKLIDEEQTETYKALEEKDLVEFLDGFGDFIWVHIGYIYFSNTNIFNVNLIMEDIDRELEYNGDFIDDLINEIADSNFSKSYELQGEGEKVGKVIKGPNFKKPDIQKIIDKYEITWK